MGKTKAISDYWNDLFFFGFVKILETWQTKEAGVSEFYIQFYIKSW